MLHTDTGHNQTARNVNIDTVQIKFPAGFNEKMKRLNVGSMSLLDTDNLYQSDILNGTYTYLVELNLVV